MFPYTRTARRRQVIITTKTDRAFRGILWARRGPLLVLKAAELLTTSGPAVAVDGEVIIDRANVDYMQVITTVEEA